MSNEKASIVCFEQFIEAFLTESSKSPASVANIRLTNCFFMIFTLKTIMIQKNYEMYYRNVNMENGYT